MAGLINTGSVATKTIALFSFVNTLKINAIELQWKYRKHHLLPNDRLQYYDLNQFLSQEFWIVSHLSASCWSAPRERFRYNICKLSRLKRWAWFCSISSSSSHFISITTNWMCVCYFPTVIDWWVLIAFIDLETKYNPLSLSIITQLCCPCVHSSVTCK